MKIRISNSNIKHDTGRAILIKVPGTSNCFWISWKMVHVKGNGYSVFLPDDWDYKLIREKSRTFSETVNIDYMEDHFANMKLKEAVHHKPDELKMETEIDESLIR
jgi:hypothetical protein